MHCKYQSFKTSRVVKLPDSGSRAIRSVASDVSVNATEERRASGHGCSVNVNFLEAGWGRLCDGEFMAGTAVCLANLANGGAARVNETAGAYGLVGLSG